MMDRRRRAKNLALLFFTCNSARLVVKPIEVKEYIERRKT